MASNRTVYHVVPAASGKKWLITQEGNDGAREEFATKGEAIDVANQWARKQQPSQVKVHRSNGNMEYESTTVTIRCGHRVEAVGCLLSLAARLKGDELMSRSVAITLIVALACALGACGQNDDRPKTSAEKSGSTSSTVGSGTAANPTKAPLQTGEVRAGTTGGEGNKTGTRTTPPPK